MFYMESLARVFWIIATGYVHLVFSSYIFFSYTQKVLIYLHYYIEIFTKHFKCIFCFLLNILKTSVRGSETARRKLFFEGWQNTKGVFRTLSNI